MPRMHEWLYTNVIFGVCGVRFDQHLEEPAQSDL
jgi:hypothetical protein